MLYYKNFETTIKAVAPTTSEMDAINTYALDNLTPEQVFVGRMALCNDQYDRRHERLPESYLKRFVDTGVGKSVLTGHNYNTDPVGRFFDAEVRKSAGVLHYVPSYYMMSDDPLVPKIKAGIIKHVSVGFYPDLRLCDICGKDYDGWWNNDDDDYCNHIKGREYEVEGKTVVARVTYGGDVEKVEKVEGSFVWLGCQYGAETIAKAADGRSLDIGPEAKRAFVLARSAGESRVWALSAAGLVVPEADTKRSVEKPAPPKEEKNVRDNENKDGTNAASDPKQEALAKMGAAYRARILKSIETRYSAAGMEATGKTIAKALESVEDVEALEAAEKDAQSVHDAAHRPAGKSVPDSSGDASASREGELTLAKSPMGGWEEDYL